MGRGIDNRERVWNVSCDDCGAVILGGRKLRLCLHCDGWVCDGCQRSHESRHGLRKHAGRSDHAETAARLVAGRVAEKTETDRMSFV